MHPPPYTQYFLNKMKSISSQWSNSYLLYDTKTNKLCWIFNNWETHFKVVYIYFQIYHSYQPNKKKVNQYLYFYHKFN